MAQSKSVLNDLSHALDLLESENARLLDDNARLQGIVTDDELRMQKVLDENAKLRELATYYDSALSRLCDQMQGHVDCQWCVLGKDYDEDTCAIDELRNAARELGGEL